MKPRRWRLWALTFIAVAIGVGALATADDDAGTAEPVERPAAAATRSTEPARRPAAAEPLRVELDRLSIAAARRDAARDPGNAFAATTWQIEPPPPPPAPSAAELAAAQRARLEPPPPPRAPALPFTYLGRFEDAATNVVMLVKDDRIHTVSAGDVIEGLYRIDRIDEQQVELTYLPLDQKQALATGGRS